MTFILLPNTLAVRDVVLGWLALRVLGALVGDE